MNKLREKIKLQEEEKDKLNANYVGLIENEKKESIKLDKKLSAQIEENAKSEANIKAGKEEKNKLVVEIKKAKEEINSLEAKFAAEIEAQ